MGKMILETKNITKRFGSKMAANQISLQIEQNSIYGLLGPNGAGKSTLIKVLTGVEERDSGTVLMEGKEIYPKSPLEAQAAGISTVYQEVNLCPNLSVAENIYIGREIRKGGRIDWKTINQKSKELMKRFDLDIDVTKNLDNYSVAIQQMIAIARACDVSAKVLILDEPTKGIDVGAKSEFYNMICQFAKQGLGVILISSELPEVIGLSDRIIVMKSLRISGEVMREEATEDRLLQLGMMGEDTHEQPEE